MSTAARTTGETPPPQSVRAASLQPAAGPGSPAAGEGGFTHRQITIILIGLMSGMLLAALDQTIVATAIRTISDNLNGLSLQAWATTAYLITSTIATPLYGKLSDIYGRRPFFIGAITIFIIGSAMSAAVTSMFQLALARGFQGIGAGGLFSMALAILGDIVPPRQRARYQGYFLAVFGTSSVLGPVVGGFFAGQPTLLGITGWRWVFLINVPIGLVSLVMVMRVLHLPHMRRDHRIDYPGALALGVGLVPLLLVAEQGRDWGWASDKALLCYALGVIGLIAFLIAESRYGDEALLPLRLFRGRTFGVGAVLNFMVGVGMFGGLAALPLYMQIVQGKSPTAAGLLLLPMMVGIMSGSVASGQFIARTGRYRIFPIMGLTLMMIGLLLMAQVDADTSLVVLDTFALIFGLGLGFNMQTLVLAIQNAVPPQDMGVATSSATFFRQMGGTLGTAVFLSVLFGRLPQAIRTAFSGKATAANFAAAAHDPAVAQIPANQRILSLAGQGGGKLSSNSLNDSSFLSHVDHRLARPFLVGFADAIDTVFLLGASVLVIAFVVVWFLPELPLRTMGGLAAQRSSSEATAAPGAPTQPDAEGSPEIRDAEPVSTAGNSD